ncbi:MAG: RNA polymerase sigma factor [Acidobacteria bacterium]|nr:RNA polymerase sigma factor [Acidobacteriota bacterium]
MQEPQLIEACQRNDALAWEQLVRNYQNRVFGFAMTFVHHRDDAHDLAQEIFVRVYKHLNSYDGSSSFQAWLFALARNCCIDRIRRNKVRSRFMAHVDEEAEFTCPQPTPQDLTETNNHRSMLQRALATLSEQSREMIVLKEIQGLKFREIADMLGIPEGTAKSRSGRARLDLAQALTRLGYGG